MGGSTVSRASRKQTFFLCEENGEQFTIAAKDWQHAQEGAAVYGGRVVRKLNAATAEAEVK